MKEIQGTSSFVIIHVIIHEGNSHKTTWTEHINTLDPVWELKTDSVIEKAHFCLN